MKQVVQDLRGGETRVVELPSPEVGPGQLLISTNRTLVSAGTERMLVEFGRAGMLDKARQQPERVRQVLQKMRTDGVLQTVDAVMSKLDEPLPLGYCNAGTVIAVGEGVNGFEVGDRVASNGSHAEVVRVPQNLAARVPEGVSDEAAAFTVLSAVGLQGIRLAEPTLGEAFVVTGLGLVGLITVQLLRAQGCRVLGIDVDSGRVALAREMGADTVDLSKSEDPVASARAFSRGRGVDGVIITASTKESTPVLQAAEMCRTRGRIVLVGVTGLELDRSAFYEKELTFQVSCSYGPGRYDAAYEEQGHDYPVGHVRWTEQRNFEAVLDAMKSGSLDVSHLITHRFPIADAASAYDALTQDRSALGILLEYEPSSVQIARSVGLEAGETKSGTLGAPSVAVIGAGNYAGRVLVPGLQQTGANLHTIVSSAGLTAANVGTKRGFRFASTDLGETLANSEIDAVVIATRHDSHAELIIQALEAGKHVFVEKPLAITNAELDRIQTAYEKLPTESRPVLAVGFNRRFAPHVITARQAVAASAEPSSVLITVNAGAIPKNHWTQDPKVGGGRLIGEGCHFVDLARHLIGSPIREASIATMGDAPGVDVPSDKTSLTLSFDDGSIASINYWANGSASFPKERVEVFNGGRVLQLDNFRTLRAFGWPGVSSSRLRKQDKGHAALLQAWVSAVQSGAPSPTPFAEVLEVSRCTTAVANLRDGTWRPTGS